MKTKIFLDIIAFTAFINRNHPKHEAIILALEDFARLNVYLYTSILVISDTHDYLLNQTSHSVAREFIKLMPYTSITVLRPTPKTQTQAQELVIAPQEFNLNLKDALNIALMKQKNIPRALSTNPHFSSHNISLISA